MTEEEFIAKILEFKDQGYADDEIITALSARKKEVVYYLELIGGLQANAIEKPRLDITRKIIQYIPDKPTGIGHRFLHAVSELRMIVAVPALVMALAIGFGITYSNKKQNANQEQLAQDTSALQNEQKLSEILGNGSSTEFLPSYSPTYALSGSDGSVWDANHTAAAGSAASAGESLAALSNGNSKMMSVENIDYQNSSVDTLGQAALSAALQEDEQMQTADPEPSIDSELVNISNAYESNPF